MYTMSNAFVLMICASKYQDDKNLKDLPSTKKDMQLMKQLWCDKYNFTMKTNNKTNDEYFLTKSEFQNLIDETRVILRRNKNNYDGFIFIYCGHGYENGIRTSKDERISFKRIKQSFSASEIPGFKDKPKIYIIDACRSLNAPLPKNVYLNEEYECKLNDHDKQMRSGPEQFKFYHPFGNVLEIYGNTPGFSVLSSRDSNGTLIGPIAKHLNVNDNVLKSKTFQQLLNPVKRDVHQQSGGNQTVEINDTILGYDLYLGIHKH